MGFHIPDSPRSSQPSGRATRQASAQTEPEVPPVSGFSARRRNAIVAALFVDVMGSPRSPAVCLALGQRAALTEQRELQHAQELAAHDRAATPKPLGSVQRASNTQP